jgi:hypothetical protein
MCFVCSAFRVFPSSLKIKRLLDGVTVLCPLARAHDNFNKLVLICDSRVEVNRSRCSEIVHLLDTLLHLSLFQRVNVHAVVLMCASAVAHASERVAARCSLCKTNAVNVTIEVIHLFDEVGKILLVDGLHSLCSAS